MTSRVPNLVVCRARALTGNVPVLDAVVNRPGLGGRQMSLGLNLRRNLRHVAARNIRMQK